MASGKRSISDTLSGGDGEYEESAQKQRRLSATPPLRSQPPISLAYPPTSQPAARAVPFQQPLPLITFSYDESRRLDFSDAAMRYYVEPPRGADLGYGYERWARRPEEKGRLDGLLRAVSEIRRRENGGPVVGVVSWRGVMTKIMTAPYEERDGWELNIMVNNGTLYLEEFISDSRLQEKNNMAPHHRLQTYYGYAFESWCTASSPNSSPGWGGDVDTSVQWCSVVKTKLGDTRIVIGGEVDCVRDRYTGRNDTMIELKTSMNIRGPQDEARFEKKLLKFYFQSFLLGVPEIVVGFRTPKGQLTTLQSFKTLHIPRMVRGKPGAWDPQICLGWGDAFLAWIKRNVTSASAATPESVWRVKFLPRVGVELSLLHEDSVREVEAGEDRVGFLPRWYWEELLELSKAESGADVDPALTIPPEAASPSKALPTGWQI
ncbi:RAI1 like PD-XK nuclease-domain-containing protein [Gloeopeniophorella convolvens]|nr:RAI1 like PD-XK nuclease-domain-containing protein [Gloeopeniophorella convolvens]